MRGIEVLKQRRCFNRMAQIQRFMKDRLPEGHLAHHVSALLDGLDLHALYDRMKALVVTRTSHDTANVGRPTMRLKD